MQNAFLPLGAIFPSPVVIAKAHAVVAQDEMKLGLVTFPHGASSAAINRTFHGSETIDFIANALVGQRLVAPVTLNSTAAYFKPITMQIQRPISRRF